MTESKPEPCKHETRWATPNGVIGCLEAACDETWTIEEYTEEIRQQAKKEVLIELEKSEVLGGLQRLKKKYGVDV